MQVDTYTAEQIAERLYAKKTVSGWMAKCPSHDDSTASLSISAGVDGKVLLKCHAGCSFSAITAALGVKQEQMYPPKPQAMQHKSSRIIAMYDYLTADGTFIFQVVRMEPKSFRQRRRDDRGEWVWDMKGVERVLYRLPQVLSAKALGRTVYVVEGEKDVAALEGLGLCATSNSGGASAKWQDNYTLTLDGAVVVVIPDKDDPGRKHGAQVMNALIGRTASVRVVELPDRDGHNVKDSADWVAAGGTAEELQELIRNAPLWNPPEPVRHAELPSVDPNESTDPTESARNGKPYTMTDLGNAERLVARHGDKIRWDTARKVWRVWDGCRWAVDDALKVNALAHETTRLIRQEAAAAPSDGDGKNDTGAALFGWAIKSENRDRLAAMVEVAKSIPRVAVSASELDADPWLFNAANGTIDLRTGILRPHDRKDLLTKLSPVDFRAGTRCQRFEDFLRSSTGNDAEVISFLQAAAGYTLSGSTAEEVLFLVYGPEASGKTTMLEALRAVMGEYARTVQADLLTKKRDSGGGGSASPQIACLAGVRMAAASEMEQGREIAEALAKNLTGGEMITARHLYSGFFDFMPQFKLWLALNHCPKVSADDGAIWRRILRIGFEHTVPKEKRDKTLKPYLRDPNGGAPTVLAWMVEGCLRWQREGLIIPAAVERSTAAYRDESDPLATFFAECLVFDVRAWTPWSDIWLAYNEAAADEGVADRFRISPKRLQARLRAKGCTSVRQHGGRGWRGVELKMSEDDARDTFDAISETYSNEPLLEESLGNDVTSVRPVTLEPAELLLVAPAATDDRISSCGDRA